MVSNPTLSSERKAGKIRSSDDESPPLNENVSRRKLSVSLSLRSSEAFDLLKKLTDADTDSEVFRNALRLHMTLLRSHLKGDRLYIRRAGDNELAAVELFIDESDQAVNDPARPKDIKRLLKQREPSAG